MKPPSLPLCTALPDAPHSAQKCSALHRPTQCTPSPHAVHSDRHRTALRFSVPPSALELVSHKIHEFHGFASPTHNTAFIAPAASCEDSGAQYRHSIPATTRNTMPQGSHTRGCLSPAQKKRLGGATRHLLRTSEENRQTGCTRQMQNAIYNIRRKQERQPPEPLP